MYESFLIYIYDRGPDVEGDSTRRRPFSPPIFID